MNSDQPTDPHRSADPDDGARERDQTPDGPAWLSGTDAALRHSLRTPLNHIIGYSELLLEDAAERGLDDLLNDLRNIHAAGKELLVLIDELFDPRPVAEDSRSPVRDAGVAPTTTSPPDAAPAVPPDGAGQPPEAHLLVVDDDDGNRDIVTRLLEREGYGVCTAGNGAEALELLGDGPVVDLVLLDVMMPVMDGIEACRRLKENPESRLIPVIIMTALGNVEDRVRGIRAGADDFLTKPVNRDELLARIQTSLRLKQTVDAKVDRLEGAQAYLARFVPQSVIRELQDNPDAPELKKTDRDMSALFLDVSGYTKLSIDMRQTADFIIEKYFSRYLDSIHAHGGDVTETSGDGLMAIFAGDDPVEHAVRAARAAVDALAKTEELNRQLVGIFDPIAVHVGINSGIAVIGPTKYQGASGTRWIYTALGPAVNLAARIAGVADGGMICIGPETAKRIQEHLDTREIGPRHLKNVDGAVMIYEIVLEQRIDGDRAG